MPLRKLVKALPHSLNFPTCFAKTGARFSHIFSHICLLFPTIFPQFSHNFPTISPQFPQIFPHWDFPTFVKNFPTLPSDPTKPNFYHLLFITTQILGGIWMWEKCGKKCGIFSHNFPTFSHIPEIGFPHNFPTFFPQWDNWDSVSNTFIARASGPLPII